MSSVEIRLLALWNLYFGLIDRIYVAIIFKSCNLSKTFLVYNVVKMD